MMSNIDENEDSDNGVNWVKRVVNNVHKCSESLDVSEKSKKKRKHWKYRQKLRYYSSIFYRDFHSPTCRKLGHKDVMEFRLNYLMI